MLDDSDSSIRELSLSLVAEMLHNQVCCPQTACMLGNLAGSLLINNIFYHSQKDPMEESIEIVLEKLLHVTKDVVAKVNFPHLGSPLASGLIPF